MKLSNSLKYAILIALTMAMVLFLVIYVERKTILVNNENQPLIALVEHVKHKSASAYIWFERVMKREKNIVFEKDMYESLDSTVKLFKQVLDGGETELGVFHKTTNVEIINTINQLLLNSIEIKYLAQERMKLRLKPLLKKRKAKTTYKADLAKGNEIGGALDQAFDAAYEKLQANYDSLSTLIKMKVSQDDIVLHNLFWTSVLLIVVVFIVFSFLLRKIVKNENLAKRALESSEKRFRTIFEEAPLAIALIDPLSGKVLDINPKYQEITGRKKEELHDFDLRSLTHPDDLQKCMDSMAFMNANKTKGFKLSKRQIQPDGSIVWEDLSIAVIEMDEKASPIAICMVEDVTERKKTEAEIIKSQENFENAQKLAQIGSWEFNLNTYELTWSKELYRIFELENPFLNGLYEAYRNKFHPDDLIKLDNVVNNAIEKAEGYYFEHRIISNNGSIRYLACIGEVIINEEGKVIVLKGTCQDITTRKTMENKLKESEQNDLLLRHAAQVPGIIYQFRFFPDGTYCFPFISDGILDLCEMTVEEVMKDPPSAFKYVNKNDLDGLMASILVSNQTLENWAYEYRVELPTKGTRWLRGNSNPEQLPDGSTLWHGYFADITEQKLTEKKLDEQKMFYENILNSLPVEIVVFDKQHKYVFVNPAAIKNDDFRSYIIGKDDFEYCEFRKRDKSIAQERRNKFLDIKKYGKTLQWEDDIVNEHGKTFSNLRGMLPLYNDKGELVQVLGFGFDITERKIAEKKLIENEALLASILETLPVAVFGKNIKNDYRFSIWNKKAEEIFGLKASDCIGKTDYDFFPKEEADWFRTKDIEASKMKEVLDIPEEVVESKYKRVIVHTQKTVVRDIKGDPLFLLGVSEDITERKKAEEKIKKSEEKYRSVVENAADTIITVDTENKIRFINHTQSGLTIEQVIGTNLYTYIPQEYQELVKQKLKRVYDSQKSQNYEILGKHSDGSTAWYSVNVGPLFLGDEVTGVTLIVRDISASKKAEEKIQQSLKEKEVLLKEVHHRVKNNLQIILSILNLQYATITDKNTRNLIRDIRSRIKAMSFIHELLYQTSDFSSINFSEYISTLTNNLIYSYSQNNSVNLKLDVGSIFLDLDQAIPCGLIVNEIITNSLKYAFTNTLNEEFSPEISILLTQENECIQLVIADNGKGFPGSVDFRNTESLGMQLVVTLVQQLGGDISLDNSNGSKYIITFKLIRTELLPQNNKAPEVKVG